MNGQMEERHTPALDAVATLPLQGKGLRLIGPRLKREGMLLLVSTCMTRKEEWPVRTSSSKWRRAAVPLINRITNYG